MINVKHSAHPNPSKLASQNQTPENMMHTSQGSRREKDALVSLGTDVTKMLHP
jgi:hypothetical protein